MPDMYKHVLTLLHRSFRLSSNYEIVYRKIETLKSKFKQKNYDQNFVNHHVKRLLDKLFIQRDY